MSEAIDVLQNVSIICAAIVVIWKAFKVTRHFADMHDVVSRELMANGGSSLVDRVGKIESKIEMIFDKYMRQ